MKKLNRYIVGIFSATILLSSFQNCGKTFELTTDLNGDAFSSLGDKSAQLSKTNNPFVCQTSSELPVRPIKRLTRIQLQNTLSDLITPELYSQVSTTTNLLFDDLLKKNIFEYSNQITDDQMQGYQKIAEAVYNLIVNNVANATKLAGSCIIAPTVTLSCKEQFIQSVGLKAFRRPLIKEEVDRFVASVYSLGESAIESVALIYYTFILSPQFQLRLEVGNTGDLTAPTFSLSSYEVASRISYEITDGPPDSTLYQAASLDQLKTKEQIEPHIDRLINSSRGKQKVIAFFKYLIDPKRFSKDSYSLDLKNGLDVDAVNDEYDRELTEYLQEMIFNQQASFEEIMTSKKSFARTPAVAQIYGHEPIIDSKTPGIMAGDRMGLLMRGPVLVGEGNETHPILRGVKLRARLLCEQMGLPSGVSTNDPLFFSDEARVKFSTRHRTEGLTASASCMSCHSAINPLGFSFENFDSLGRTRLAEKAFSLKGDFLAEHPVDTRNASVDLGGGNSEAVEDGQDLIYKLLDKNQIGACFVKQMHRFYLYLSETDMNNCDFRKTYDQLVISNSNNSLLTVMKNRVLTADLLVRRIPSN